MQQGAKRKQPSESKENLPTADPTPARTAAASAVHDISSSDDDRVQSTGRVSMSQPANKSKKGAADPTKAMFKNDPVFGGRGGARLSMSQPSTSGKRKKTDGADGSLGLSDEDSVSSNNRTRKARKTPKKKGYLPKPGTAGYAIILALYNKSQDPGFAGHMTKDELIRAAQPMADCDMRRPAVGKEYYCGWSTSTTLERKGLIEMWSNPKKICLTEAGIQLALRIKSNQAEAQNEVNGGADEDVANGGRV